MIPSVGAPVSSTIPAPVVNVGSSGIALSPRPPSARKTPINSSRKRPLTAIEDENTAASSYNKQIFSENIDEENITTASSSSNGTIVKTARSVPTELSPKPFRIGGGAVNKPLPIYSFLSNGQGSNSNGGSYYVSTASKSRLGNPVRKQPSGNLSGNNSFIANGGASRIQNKLMGSDLSAMSSSSQPSLQPGNLRKKTKFFR